jgi:predicted DNA-binding mobile mystery protein A
MRSARAAIPLHRTGCNVVTMRTLRSMTRNRLLNVSAELQQWQPRRRPVCGWIRYIRDALNMNAFQLGRRIGVRQPTMARLEQKERDGTITLNALARVAQGLDCVLVYGLVPRASLASLVDEQARRAVRLTAGEPADTEELERTLLVRMPRWIWGSWEQPQLYGMAEDENRS